MLAPPRPFRAIISRGEVSAGVDKGQGGTAWHGVIVSGGQEVKGSQSGGEGFQTAWDER